MEAEERACMEDCALQLATELQLPQRRGHSGVRGDANPDPRQSATSFANPDPMPPVSRLTSLSGDFDLPGHEAANHQTILMITDDDDWWQTDDKGRWKGDSS